MFVLPNSTTATKRSSRKPKRFTSDESTMNDPEMDAIWRAKRKRGKQPEQNKQEQLPPQVADEIQHVSIDITRIPETEIEPWCMIHQLYKCHCKGKSQKGRPFTITIKKTASDMDGGWEVVSGRKRQYTFEQDNIANASNGAANSAKKRSAKPIPNDSAIKNVHGVVNNTSRPDEPPAKTMKIANSTDRPPIVLSFALNSAARIRPIDRDSLKSKTEYEIRKLRNACIFAETPFTCLLKERIEVCRRYNKAQNVLMKTSNAQKNLLQNVDGATATVTKTSTSTATTSKEIATPRVMTIPKAIFTAPLPPPPPPPPTPSLPSTSNDNSTSCLVSQTPIASTSTSIAAPATVTSNNDTDISIQRLNAVISSTMQRLTTNQRLNKIVLNPTPNKMSFISWDRFLIAFKARQLFVWDVRLVDNEQALIVTDDFHKPNSPRYISVTNINYVDINELPMIAKLIRNDFRNEKTNYLGNFTTTKCPMLCSTQLIN